MTVTRTSFLQLSNRSMQFQNLNERGPGKVPWALIQLMPSVSLFISLHLMTSWPYSVEKRGLFVLKSSHDFNDWPVRRVYSSCPRFFPEVWRKRGSIEREKVSPMIRKVGTSVRPLASTRLFPYTWLALEKYWHSQNRSYQTESNKLSRALPSTSGSLIGRLSIMACLIIVSTIRECCQFILLDLATASSMDSQSFGTVKVPSCIIWGQQWMALYIGGSGYLLRYSDDS